MSSLSRELVFLILQFLNEEKLNETVHELEQESGFFFNMKYFEDEVHNGNWDEVERYLSGFTKVDDNSYSMKIFLEIIKQKDLEALDKENEPLFKYGDTKSARTIMLVELKKLIEANPLFRDKLQFPNLKNSRLRTLINQSLNWQHQLCRNPRPNPDIKTLFADHTCGQPNGALAPSPANNPLLGSIPKARGFPPLGAHGRRSLTTQQSKKAKTSKDLVLSTARVLFRLVFNLLILLAAFYIYWNLSATITEIRENRTTIKQGISQFVIDAQGLIGWIYDESNSGFNEDRSGGKVGTARRILRFVG